LNSFNNNTLQLFDPPTGETLAQAFKFQAGTSKVERNYSKMQSATVYELLSKLNMNASRSYPIAEVEL